MHLYLALLLLALLVVHVILHGKTILTLLTRFISQPVSRLGVASVFLMVALTLLALPLLATPEVNEVGVREDSGLEAPSSGIEWFILSAANPEALKREPAIDPADQAVAEVEWTKASSLGKVAHKKSHSEYWPKSPQYQTIYPLNFPEDNALAHSQKRTSTLLACCQPPRRRIP